MTHIRSRWRKTGEVASVVRVVVSLTDTSVNSYTAFRSLRIQASESQGVIVNLFGDLIIRIDAFAVVHLRGNHLVFPAM